MTENKPLNIKDIKVGDLLRVANYTEGKRSTGMPVRAVTEGSVILEDGGEFGKTWDGFKTLIRPEIKAGMWVRAQGSGTIWRVEKLAAKKTSVHHPRKKAWSIDRKCECPTDPDRITIQYDSWIDGAYAFPVASNIAPPIGGDEEEFRALGPTHGEQQRVEKEALLVAEKPLRLKDIKVGDLLQYYERKAYVQKVSEQVVVLEDGGSFFKGSITFKKLRRPEFKAGMWVRGYGTLGHKWRLKCKCSDRYGLLGMLGNGAWDADRRAFPDGHTASIDTWVLNVVPTKCPEKANDAEVSTEKNQDLEEKVKYLEQINEKRHADVAIESRKIAVARLERTKNDLGLTESSLEYYVTRNYELLKELKEKKVNDKEQNDLAGLYAAEQEDIEEQDDLDNSLAMDLPEEIREAAKKAGIGFEDLTDLILTVKREDRAHERVKTLDQYEQQHDMQVLNHKNFKNNQLQSHRNLVRKSNQERAAAAKARAGRKIEQTHEQELSKIDAKDSISFRATEIKLAKIKARVKIKNEHGVAASYERCRSVNSVARSISQAFRWATVTGSLSYIAYTVTQIFI